MQVSILNLYLEECMYMFKTYSLNLLQLLFWEYTIDFAVPKSVNTDDIPQGAYALFVNATFTRCLV